MLKDNDPVNHPNHYTSHPSGIECIQITEHMDFNLGNALKYIWRADLKHDAIEDLNKALFYINRELNRRQHWTAGEDPNDKQCGDEGSYDYQPREPRRFSSEQAYINEAEQVEQIRALDDGPVRTMSLEDCADIARAMGVHI